MKKLRRNLLALVVLALAAGAGAFAYSFIQGRGNAPQEPEDAGPVITTTEKKAPSSRPLEFADAMYATVPSLSADDGSTFTLSNGAYESDSFEAELDTGPSAHAFGDLNGDGSSELAVAVGENGGGSGYFVYLEIFTSVDNQAKYLASAFLGDRITIRRISIAGGIVTADIITQGPGEPMCCGTMPKTISYKLSGDTLVETPSPAANR